MNYIKIASLLILVILLLNLYITFVLINGNYISTEEFAAESGAQIILNIQGIIKKSCRFIFIGANDETEIMDSGAWIICAPSLFLQTKARGYIIFSEKMPFPRRVKFMFDAVAGSLRIYGKILYGEFTKIH
jgi:hypothetical protein